jgi:hypothetical protein
MSSAVAARPLWQRSFAPCVPPHPIEDAR